MEEQKTSEEAPVATPENPSSGAPAAAAGGQKHAGFWIRFLAYIIDAIILGIVGTLLGQGTFTQGAEGFSANVGFTGWYSLIPLVYIIGFWVWKSATPGKMILKLKIIQQNGKDLDIKSAIIRFIGYIVSAIILGIGFIMIGFTKDKTGLHDKIAKTYVVKQ